VRLVIVTGMSGSGKSTASKALEDIGFFCIDNLPIRLLPDFLKIELYASPEFTKVAFVMDTRERKFVEKFPEMYRQLKEKGFNIEILFLDASDEVLVRRFSETRRPHPLAESGTVMDGINKERSFLEPLRQLADSVLNTSEYNVHDLRKRVQELFSQAPTGRLVMTVESFGHKYGVPPNSDIVLDVRFIPNPYFIPDLHDKSGLNKEVMDFVMKHEEARKFLDRVVKLLEFLIPLYEREGKTYLTVSVGCTGGRHRSVVIAERLAASIKKKGYRVLIEHRDIERG